MTDTTVEKTPLSVRAVERAAALVSGRGATRRRFLARAAVIGSALAMNPLGYILRPGTAYASVCGSGNTCGSGWSVFCCTINGGANTCPDYSFVAGWWKVDNSAFCLGAPRYYIDCNRRPGGRCSCRCNSGGCDRRRVCCNVFRYGQCNTHIRGVTEVVCRIITCTPPWQWDPACGTAVRTSNATRSHSAACLPGKNPSRIEIKYQDMGLVGSVLGRPVSRERDAAGGGRKRRYERGMILWHRDFGAHAVPGSMATRYRQYDAEAGVLGYPRTDVREVGRGTAVRFERGSIYHHVEAGTRIVTGRTDRRFRALGGAAGSLGFPIAGTHDVEGQGDQTHFQRGSIFVSPRTDPVEVTARVLDVYTARGGPVGSGLGWPVARRRNLDDGTVRQRFENGLITGPRPRDLYVVRGPILDRWLSEGAHRGGWGQPVDHTTTVPDTDGEESHFAGRGGYWSPATAVHWVDGPILIRYVREGGPAGTFGFPLTDPTTDPASGRVSVTFQRGIISYDPASGETEAAPDSGEPSSSSRGDTRGWWQTERAR